MQLSAGINAIILVPKQMTTSHRVTCNCAFGLLPVCTILIPQITYLCLVFSLFSHRVPQQPPVVLSRYSPCCLCWRASGKRGSQGARTPLLESCPSRSPDFMESIWIRSPGLTGNPGIILDFVKCFSVSFCRENCMNII